MSWIDVIVVSGTFCAVARAEYAVTRVWSVCVPCQGGGLAKGPLVARIPVSLLLLQAKRLNNRATNGLGEAGRT